MSSPVSYKDRSELTAKYVIGHFHIRNYEGKFLPIARNMSVLRELRNLDISFTSDTH